MTIQNRTLNNRLGNLETCADSAPEGTYDDVKRAVAAIGDAIESVRAIIQARGLRADGSDHCRNLEVAIYEFMLASNPDACTFAVGEGFGEHVQGPAGDRIMANAGRDRDAFRALGLI